MNQEAKAALDLRLARGEISHEEYTKTLELLATSSGSTTPAQVSHKAPPPSPAGQSASPKPKQPMGKGCMGCLGVVVLLMVIGWITEIGGCDGDNKPPRSAQAPADPSIRYIGVNGAVAGYDNYGSPVRLPPGTGVRATGGTYMGTQKIYVVTEGALAGMQVPLSESDLRPQ
jgi:hypothetical protein